jgi:hypothetical protein
MSNMTNYNFVDKLVDLLVLITFAEIVLFFIIPTN